MVARDTRPGDAPRASSRETEGRPDAIVRWERNRAMGRSTFIWRRGVFGWGIPVALLTIAYQVVQEQGFVWRLVMTQHLKTGIAIAMLVFPLCGYLWALSLDHGRGKLRADGRIQRRGSRTANQDSAVGSSGRVQGSRRRAQLTAGPASGDLVRGDRGGFLCELESARPLHFPSARARG